MALRLPLTELENQTLIEVRLRAAVDQSRRRIVDRLIHLGLVDETPRGLALTAYGVAIFIAEVRQRGIGWQADA